MAHDILTAGQVPEREDMAYSPESNVNKAAQSCIHCRLCTDNCGFLSKYGIDIGDTERLRELAYHCFLCGRCSDVCPVDIDGRQVVLDLRRERADSAERPQLEKTYKGLLGEKRDYRFRSWKHVTSGTVFFPGCNLPSLFPRTCSKAARIFAAHGIGTVYECCGKPVAELGFRDDEENILNGIRAKLRANNIEEIVTACPNCRDFFGDRLGVKVTGVYAKLKELGEGRALNMGAVFYFPCPDRNGDVWMAEISEFIRGGITCVEGVSCCGLGGGAAKHEKEIAEGFAAGLAGQDRGQIYTYCASCTGAFRRNGYKAISHILPLILDTGEDPDTAKSYLNRMLTKFK